MKECKLDKDAVLIYRAMDGRLAELWKKLTSGNYNAATQYAYELGFISDIERVIKRIKKKEYNRALDNHHILHGADAKRFIEQVEHPKPLSKEQKRLSKLFLKNCDKTFMKVKKEGF